MASSRSHLLPTPHQCAEWFAGLNLAFLAVDIYLAHSINRFANPMEWVPVIFSVVAPLLLLIGWMFQLCRPIGYLVGWISVVVGITGLLLHLDSQFFQSQTLRSLVYTAPFVAPLAYTGVGLLLILNRMVNQPNAEWAAWVLLLAAAGFVGNFILSLADHAQNGFWRNVEWMAVVAAALAVGFLVVPLMLRVNRGYLRICFAVMGLEMVVGMIGEACHVWADLHGSSPHWFNNFLYGAPAFAPLLFANLAMLGCIGLWAMFEVAK